MPCIPWNRIAPSYFNSIYSMHSIHCVVFHGFYNYSLQLIHYVLCACDLLNFESCCGQTDIVTHRAAIAAKNVTKALLCGQLQTNKNFLGANFTSKMNYVLLTFNFFLSRASALAPQAGRPWTLSHEELLSQLKTFRFAQ